MNKQQTLIKASLRLAEALAGGDCQAVELAEVTDDDNEPLVTLTWYADAQPEAFVVADVRRDVPHDAQIARARTLGEAVELLHRVAGDMATHRDDLRGVPIMAIHPHPDPETGHSFFRLDTDLLDLWCGQITEAEYMRRQDARRRDREGGHYRSNVVPGGV